MRSPKGRLELTWMGKDMALTATRLTHLAPDEVTSRSIRLRYPREGRGRHQQRPPARGGSCDGARYMNFRRLKMATSAAPSANHSPFARRWLNRWCQYLSMPAGSSVEIW